MENISAKDLTEELTKIYGVYVVNDIKDENNIDLDTPIYGFEMLEKLLEKFLSNNKSYLNYYRSEHKQVTRFILITIEKFYGNSSIDFSEPAEKSKNFSWEIEHIIPQNSENQNIETIKKENLNNIGNLTLLPSGINGDSNYGNKNVQKKKEFLKSELSKGILTINDCFELDTFGDAEIENRKNELLNKFNNIFYEPGKSRCTENFSIENFVRKLGLREF